MSAREPRRRWPIVASALVAGVLGVAAFGWFVWLPHYRPGLPHGGAYGIDVSHFQGEIDWERVAADGIAFAYIKATEGGDFVDPRFAENWTGAGAAQLDRGAYHFFTLCTSGADQARNFLSVVPADPGALPPALDLEFAGNCAARPVPEVVRRELGAYLQLVEWTMSGKVVLYVRDEFEAAYPVRTWFARPQWRARFLLPPSEDWIVWQVGAFAQIDGIPGRVDLDVVRSIK